MVYLSHRLNLTFFVCVMKCHEILVNQEEENGGID